MNCCELCVLVNLGGSICGNHLCSCHLSSAKNHLPPAPKGEEYGQPEHKGDTIGALEKLCDFHKENAESVSGEEWEENQEMDIRLILAQSGVEDEWRVQETMSIIRREREKEYERGNRDADSSLKNFYETNEEAKIKEAYERGREEGEKKARYSLFDTKDLLAANERGFNAGRKSAHNDTLDSVEKIISTMRVILYSEDINQYNRNIERENVLNELQSRLKANRDI